MHRHYYYYMKEMQRDVIQHQYTFARRHNSSLYRYEAPIPLDPLLTLTHNTI